MSFLHNRWRAPVTGAVTGLAVAAGIIGPSALASGGTASTPRAKVARASDTPCTAPAGTKAAQSKQAPGTDPSPAPFLAAVAQLQQAGTINAAQARVLDADIRTGSIDSEALVANGTLTSAQMQAVNDRLAAVKRSLAPDAGSGTAADAHGKG